MAILKQLTSDDGVPIVYHRISAITITTNIENLIEVKSYPTQELREEEAVKLAGEDPAFKPWTQTRWYSAPYNPEMTVESAYEWLKESELISIDNPNPFLGAEDESDFSAADVEAEEPQEGGE